jgi:hypothetical protein
LTCSLFSDYNLAIIISHRGWPKEQAEDLNATPDDVHKTSSLDAARDMVVHIHQLFRLAPSLRRWSYYCFYCLQATLVLLMRITDEPFAEGIEDSKSLCELSIQIFEQIELKAAKRCAEIVRQVLDQGQKRIGAWKSSGNLTGTSQEAPDWLSDPSSSSQNGIGNRLPNSHRLHFEPYDFGHSESQNTADALYPKLHSSHGIDGSSWLHFSLADEDWPLQALEGFASSF